MIIRGTSTTFQDKSKRIEFTITKKPDVSVAAPTVEVAAAETPTLVPIVTPSSTATVANELTTEEKAQLDKFKNEIMEFINKEAPNGDFNLDPIPGIEKENVNAKKQDDLYKKCYTVKDSNPPLTLRIVPTFGDGTCGYYAIQDKTGYETNITNKISRQIILGKLKARLQSNDDYESIQRIKTYNDFGGRLLSDIDNILKGGYADIGVEENLPTDEISYSLDLCSEVLDTPIEVYKLERDNDPTSDLVLMRKYIPTNQTNPIRRIHHTTKGCHFSILQECGSENHKQFFEPIQLKGGKRKTLKKQKKPRSRKIRDRRPKKNITSKSI